jgi:hypothetical protein
MMESHEEKQRIAAKIVSVFDATVHRKRGENAVAMEVYAPVDSTEADRIQAATGLDVRGYFHSIGGYEILHVLKKHGEGNGDPRPITKEDFERLYEVITTADEIVDEGLTNTGLPGITYKKRINGHIVVVEEYRRGKGNKKRLAFKTMYKTKN